MFRRWFGLYWNIQDRQRVCLWLNEKAGSGGVYIWIKKIRHNSVHTIIKTKQLGWVYLRVIKIDRHSN